MTFQITSRLTERTFYIKAKYERQAISRVWAKFRSELPTHDNFYVINLK